MHVPQSMDHKAAITSALESACEHCGHVLNSLCRLHVSILMEYRSGDWSCHNTVLVGGNILCASSSLHLKQKSH